MSGLDDGLSRLPNGARYVAALGPHLCMLKVFGGFGASPIS